LVGSASPKRQRQLIGDLDLVNHLINTFANYFQQHLVLTGIEYKVT